MPRPLGALALAAFALAGCGNARTPAPDVGTPAQPSGSRVIALDEAGVRFTAPQNWAALGESGSRAGGVGSGRATVAVWRYVRSEPLPRTRKQTERVSELLVERVEERDPTASIREARVSRRRIELHGTQTINDVRVGVRSLHLFAHGAEVVVDAYAPVEQFDALDVSVFRPLLESVELRKPK